MEDTAAHFSKKRRLLQSAEAQRAVELEALLFGGSAALHDELGQVRALDDGAAQPLLVEDRTGQPDGAAAAAAAAAAATPRRAVWEDEDDERVQVDVAGIPRLRKLRQAEAEAVLSGRQYEQRLRQQHSKLNPRTDWATADQGRPHGGRGKGEEDEDGDDAVEARLLLQRAGGLLARGAVLPPGSLETTRLRDANQEEPCQAVVQSVEFHPNGQLLMTGSLDKRLRFFSVDGVKNPKVQSVFLEDMPVHKAAFAAGGTQVLAAGRRKFFYVFDLAAAKVERVAGLFVRQERSFESFVTNPAGELAAFFGNDGTLPLVSLRSRQMVGTLKMSGTARAGAFSADGNELLTSGSDGVVYVWDLRTQRCLSRYQDEGSLAGVSLAAAPGLFASGSSSGVVNIYGRESGASQSSHGSSGGWATPAAPLAAKPLKTVLNLTTAIDTLAFNHDAQILAIASRMKRDALRLLHLPSMTVFSNWPTSKSPLHYVHSLAFSPTSGYLAIGNARGRALLYRLHAYPAV